MKLINYLLILVLLSGCASTSPRQWNVEHLLFKGHETIDLMDEKGSTIKSITSKRLETYVEICNNVARVAGTQINFNIIEGTQPNAFAYVNDGKGYVAFNFGIIDLLGYQHDMVAAICGHEIAHLIQDHGLKRKNINEGITIVKTVTSIALSAAGVPFGGTIADLGGGIVVSKYTRDQETEADSFGVTYMMLAGYGAVRLFQELDKVSKSLSVPFLNTHPHSPERVNNIMQVAENVRQDNPNIIPIDEQEIQEEIRKLREEFGYSE